MSTLDARIIQFMNRKEAQFPELKQPSVVIYCSLRDEMSLSGGIDHAPKTFKKAINNPLGRALFTT